MWHGKALAYVAAAVTATAVCQISLQRLQRCSVARPDGRPLRMDRQDAITASAALFLAMTGSRPDLSRVTAEFYAHGTPGAERTRWRVTEGEGGRGSAFTFVWDPATGELLAASTRAIGNSRGAPVRTARQAAQRSWQWMQRLGLAARCPEWRLRREPQLDHGTWCIQWEGTDRSAFVYVTMGSGACVSAFASGLFPVPLGTDGPQQKLRGPRATGPVPAP